MVNSFTVRVKGLRNSVRLTAPTAEGWICIFAWAALVIYTLATIGTSLVGRTTFMSVEILGRIAPWAFDSPSSLTNWPVYLADPVDAGTPNAVLFLQALRNGQLWEWNPYQSGGFPLGSLPDIGYFSPLAWPWWVLPFWLAPAWVKLSEVVVITVGVSLLLRRFDLSPATWPVASLAYTASGQNVAWTNWPQPRIAALLPLLFFGLDCLAGANVDQRRYSRWRGFLVVALVCAGMATTGFPAMFGFAIYAGTAYLIFRSLQYRKNFKYVLIRILAAGGALATGLLLSAFTLLPFVANYLNEFDDTITQREWAGDFIDFRYLATTVMPWAGGSPLMSTDTPRPTDLGNNVVEGWSFIGPAVLLLFLLGLAWRYYSRRDLGLVTFFGFATVLASIPVFFGGPLLDLLQMLPIFSNNGIGRFRFVIFFFVAILAAFGMQNLINPASPTAENFVKGTWPVRIGLSLIVVFAIIWALVTVAGQTPEPGLFRRMGLVLLAITLISIAAILPMLRPRNFGIQVTALVVLLALVTIPAIRATRVWWQQADVGRWYPWTQTHQYLAETLGEQRYVQTDSTMFPGTNTYYQLRSFTGRGFHNAAWRELITAVEPDAMQSHTYSILRANNIEHSIQNGILSRFAVEYLVTSPLDPILGRPGTTSTQTGGKFLFPNQPISSGIHSGPIRGGTFATGNLRLDYSHGTPVTVSVVDLAGNTWCAATTFVRISEGFRQAALPCEQIPTDIQWRAEISFTAEAAVSENANLEVGIDADGQFAFNAILPADDGLTVVHGGDSTVYQRVGALPRIRWANQEIVAELPAERLNILQDSQTPGSAIVLQHHADAKYLSNDSTADITDLTSDPDTVKLMVTSDGPGWVIIADAIQRAGWSATLDSTPTPITPAEHAAGAIFVPTAGTHQIQLEFRLPMARAGLAISAVTALGLIASHLLVRRRYQEQPSVHNNSTSAALNQPKLETPASDINV